MEIAIRDFAVASSIRKKMGPLIATISSRRSASIRRRIVSRLLAVSLHHRWIPAGQGILSGNRADRWPVRRVQIGVLRLAVPPQVHLTLEGPAAEVAGERLEARVLPRVRDQVAALRERLAAHLTLVGLLACNRKGTEGAQRWPIKPFD